MHPVLLALYAAFEDREGIHLVQELATGGDLYHLLASSGGHLREGVVSSLVVRPLLDALAYLHDQVGGSPLHTVKSACMNIPSSAMNTGIQD